jgi:hypothetical protein
MDITEVTEEEEEEEGETEEEGEAVSEEAGMTTDTIREGEAEGTTATSEATAAMTDTVGHVLMRR